MRHLEGWHCIVVLTQIGVALNRGDIGRTTVKVVYTGSVLRVECTDIELTWANESVDAV